MGGPAARTAVPEDLSGMAVPHPEGAPHRPDVFSPGPIRSVYVHAPFCARRCPYCDFAVTVNRKGDGEGWLRAIGRELGLVEAEGRFPLAETLETLFVGGGTPSLLGPGAMGGLAGLLGAQRLEDPALEWTAEANPESFSREVASSWARAGVNRISLGAQSFHEGVLHWMGRLHGPEEVRQAVERARGTGITNLSIDLIFGLPDELHRDWREDLDRALAMEVPHLSLYGLTVEKGTPLARWVKEERVTPASEDRYRDEYLEASRSLAEAGFRHYEVSNFALPGFEARHNRAYWDLVPYLGLGNSAHSFRFPIRRWNVRDWRAYTEILRQGTVPLESEESLTAAQARLERVWLGLRTDRGIGLPPEGSASGALVESWEKMGYATTGGERVRLTPEGWLILDRLAVELDSLLGTDPIAG